MGINARVGNAGGVVAGCGEGGIGGSVGIANVGPVCRGAGIGDRVGNTSVGTGRVGVVKGGSVGIRNVAPGCGEGGAGEGLGVASDVASFWVAVPVGFRSRSGLISASVCAGCIWT